MYVCIYSQSVWYIVATKKRKFPSDVCMYIFTVCMIHSSRRKEQVSIGQFACLLVCMLVSEKDEPPPVRKYACFCIGLLSAKKGKLSANKNSSLSQGVHACMHPSNKVSPHPTAHMFVYVCMYVSMAAKKGQSQSDSVYVYVYVYERMYACQQKNSLNPTMWYVPVCMYAFISLNIQTFIYIWMHVCVGRIYACIRRKDTSTERVCEMRSTCTCMLDSQVPTFISVERKTRSRKGAAYTKLGIHVLLLVGSESGLGASQGSLSKTKGHRNVSFPCQGHDSAWFVTAKIQAVV
jgi:hypothetical protein